MSSAKGDLIVLQVYEDQKRIKALCLSGDGKGISSVSCAVNRHGQYILPERVVYFTPEKLVKVQKQLDEYSVLEAVAAKDLASFGFRGEDDSADPVPRKDDLETKLNGARMILDAMESPSTTDNMKKFASEFNPEDLRQQAAECERLLASGAYVRVEDILFSHGVASRRLISPPSPVQGLMSDLRAVGLNPKFVKADDDGEDDSIEVTKSITIQIIRPEVYGGRDVRFILTIEDAAGAFTMMPAAGRQRVADMVAKKVGPTEKPANPTKTHQQA